MNINPADAIKYFETFSATWYGEIVVRVALVTFCAEGLRLLLKKALDVVGLYTDTRKNKIEALAEFFGYASNIIMGLALYALFSSNTTPESYQLVKGFAYGCASVFIHTMIIDGRMMAAVRVVLPFIKK